MRSLGAVLLVTGMLLSSCGGSQKGGPGATATSVPAHQVSLQSASGTIAGIAWPHGDWLFSGYDPNPTQPGSLGQVWRFHPDGSDFQPVSLPDDPACRRTSYGGFGALNDGRLAIVEICDLPLGSSPSAAYGIVAYDVNSRKVETLVPPQTRLRPTGTLWWSPDDSRAIAAESSQICASIAYLTKQGIIPIPAEISDGTHSWKLDAYFQQPFGTDCQNEGRADGPSWSPDGKTIAFWGSPQSIGLEGTSRLDASFNLYFLDPNTTKVRKVVDNVAYPSSLSWSPDGRWLAFGASSVPGMTGGGTWLFSPPSGKFYRVSDKIMVQVVWSPDGTRLVGSWQAGTGSFPIQTQLFMFDVEGLLNSTK